MRQKLSIGIRIAITIIIIALPVGVIAQQFEHGLPRFINYAPKEYKQESQNFCVTQDKFGFMYFGNLNKVMRFDNTGWEIIPINGRPMMDVSINGTVYVGGHNKVGKINSYFNKMEFIEIPLPPNNEPGQIEKVIALPDQVLYCAQNSIFSYKNDTLLEVYHSVQNIIVFEANNKIYFSISGKGLFYFDIVSYKTKEVTGFEYFNYCDVFDVISIDQKQLLIRCADNSGFYIFDGKQLRNFYTEADIYIKENGYVKSIILPNKSIVVGTEYGGIICVDDKGKYLFSLNKKHGLLDNRVTDIYVNNNDKLWISTYNGITMIDYPSPLGYFNTSFGINGAISSMIRFNNGMYFGSTEGLYYYNYDYMANSDFRVFDDENSFVKVEGIVAETQDLISIDSTLWIVSSKGIYRLIEKGKARLSIEGDFRKLLKVKSLGNVFFAIGKNGVLILDNQLDSLHIIGKIKNFDYDVRTMAEADGKIIWIGSNNDGLFRFDFNGSNILSPKIQQYNEKNGLPKGFTWIDVYKTSKGILFSTQKGVFSYVSGKFTPHPYFNNSNTKEINYFFPITEYRDGKIWFSSLNEKKSERITGYLIITDGNLKYHTNPLNILRETNVESIYCDENNVVWFGGFDGLVRYDYNNSSNKIIRPLCVIRKTDLPEASNNDLFDITGQQTEHPELNYSQNHIRFDFTALFYDSYRQIEYRTKLEGFQDEWSKWGSETFKEYTYLPAGKYTFLVQAKDIYGNYSETQRFEFSVVQPIYLRWWAYVFYALFLASFVYLILKFNELRHAADKNKLERIVSERTDELVRQKEQTQKLVQRLLPEKTVEELQKDGVAQSKKYDLVTVLFSDIQGFTKIAELVDPQTLVIYLNRIFSSFDSIIANYEIDKIKTIGDAYMCAGGMRQKDRTTPLEMIMAGLQMQDAIEDINKEFGINFKMRIGVHTGSVIAGVVGSQKIEYDIWGDTVNIASRMESSGMVGMVNMSSTTYEYVRDFFECEVRGKTAVKYKGDLDMYLALRFKPHLSNDSTGKTPNKQYYIKVQNLRYADLEEFMLQKIERDLPKNLYYHNVRHTVNVCTRVENIGREEKVTEEELLLLKTAALFHDAGFMISYDNNEPLGANLAADILPLYRYKPDQIQRIKELILSTKMPPKPKNHLEQIMCDADLDYLGRTDFIVVSQNLFRELFERHKVSTIEDWNRYQYKFISKHEYFTATGRKLRDAGKKIVLEELKKRI